MKELVELLWLKGDEPVTVEGKTLPLNEALQWHFELTVNTANIVENYATLTRSETLLLLVGDKAKVRHGLQSILRETDADEIMVNGQIFDHQARLHSFELAMDVKEELLG